MFKQSLRENFLLFYINNRYFKKAENIPSSTFDPPVYRFKFKEKNKYNNTFQVFLIPPYADNLVSLLKNDKKLSNQIGNFF